MNKRLPLQLKNINNSQKKKQTQNSMPWKAVNNNKLHRARKKLAL